MIFFRHFVYCAARGHRSAAIFRRPLRPCLPREKSQIISSDGEHLRRDAHRFSRRCHHPLACSEFLKMANQCSSGSPLAVTAPLSTSTTRRFTTAIKSHSFPAAFHPEKIICPPFYSPFFSPFFQLFLLKRPANE